MNNYQLYRTNLLLSGQMKWDLILNSSDNTLYISDFHLTPISSNTPYTYKLDEQLLNNKHEDNVKAYYNANKGNFYKEYLNAEFEHNYPIINNELVNSYSNIYDMGCKRSKLFNLYNKQFEFFCPLWLEKIDNDIKFKISVKNISTENLIAENTLSLSKDVVNNKFHNRFIEYFNNYIQNAGLKDGTDDIINISFNKNIATVTGFNVNKGIFETLYIDHLIDNLTSIERPLLEADNMIIRALSDNYILCKQLFNFNLCFNLDDIFSSNIVEMIYGENIYISVSVFIGDMLLELKDFYTEYDYILKDIKTKNNIKLEYTDEEKQSLNIFNYLKDNKYIEFINKNKFCQSICHWSLSNNNDYIFNLYEGFSGLYIEEQNNIKTVYSSEHLYGNSPNTYINSYDKGQNTVNWLSYLDLTNDIEAKTKFYEYVKYTNVKKTDGVFISNNSEFIKNLKYSYIPESINNETNGFYLLGLVVNESIFKDIKNELSNHNLLYLQNNQNNICNICLLNINDLIILFTYDINNLAFNKFKKIINDSSLTNNIVAELKKMINSKIEPSLILINNSLSYTIANSPSNESTEIDYVKDINNTHYVIRYDGKIKPTFTDKISTLYYKDYISENDIDNSIYTKYNILNYEPLYPSIGYCSIKKLNNWSYTECPEVKVSAYENNVHIYDNNYEYQWFNNSKCLVLNSKLLINKITNKDIDEIISEFLCSYYNISNDELYKLQYIKNLYSYSTTWEYSSNTDVNNYIYNITLSLK